jgi:arsenate reductase
MDVTIYHNPKCGTSRNTLAMLRKAGIEPKVIEYLKTPPTSERIVELIAMMGTSARDLIRRKGAPFDELDLGDPKWTDDQLIEFMIEHPILINRPIVVAGDNAKLCRPCEVLLELIPGLGIGQFTKEDGEQVIGEKGARADSK